MIHNKQSSSHSLRNSCAKAVLTFLIGFGITCDVFATQSFGWYTFNHDIDNVETWNFLPTNRTAITSIGLFRYQTDSLINQGPFGTRGHLYDPAFVGTSNPWVFSAQICVVTGPILAFLGWITAISKIFNKSTSVLALTLATGVQWTSVITAMSLCDQFMTCPWLLGSLANVFAASSFLLAWIVSYFGLVNVGTKGQPGPFSDDSMIVGGSTHSIVRVETMNEMDQCTNHVKAGLEYEASYGISSMEQRKENPKDSEYLDDDVEADQKTEKASNQNKNRRVG